MREKILKLFWVILLVISSFTLGYYLKPAAPTRAMMLKGFPGSSRTAPPLSFRQTVR